MTKSDKAEYLKKLRLEADEVREVTLEEAKALPGILGRTVWANLKYHGYRDLILDGKKVLFVLK